MYLDEEKLEIGRCQFALRALVRRRNRPVFSVSCQVPDGDALELPAANPSAILAANVRVFRMLRLPLMLAGLPRGPSDYDPIRHVAVDKQRHAVVLDAMVKGGCITQAAANSAKAGPLQFKILQFPYCAPHLVYYVTQWLQQRYGYNAVYDRRWRIQTTRDLGLNELASRRRKNRSSKFVVKRIRTMHACSRSSPRPARFWRWLAVSTIGTRRSMVR